MRLMLIMY